MKQRIVPLIHYFFPDLAPEEIKKFGLLSLIFFLIIGSAWLLRLLKYTIFLKVAFPTCLGWPDQQGCLFQSIAKSWSPLVVLVMVLLYSKLVDLVKRHQLFYVICAFYATQFAIYAGILWAKDTYGAQALGKEVLALLGWFSYFSIESFASLAVALFWSFTNSITDTNGAKRGFPLLVAMAQLSAILGSGTMFFSGSIGALWPIVALASILIMSVIPLVYYFVKQVQLPAEQPVADTFLEGFIAGITLLFTRPYLLGILLISTIYEALYQIVEYQMQAYASMSDLYHSEIAFAQFQGLYGIGINSLSFAIALMGTGYIFKRLGVRMSLLIYPIVFALIMLGLLGFFMLNPTTHTLLWAIVGAMTLLKGIGFAINNPTKEIMYIPTSTDAKFKTKGWIDTFGSRFSELGGAHVTNMFKHNIGELMIYGSLVSFGLIGVWLAAALFVGYKNQQLVQRGMIVS